MDEFLIEAVSLKGLQKVRMGHDSSGAGAGWFLDKVVIKDPEDNTKEYVFPCNRFGKLTIYKGMIRYFLFIFRLISYEIVFNSSCSFLCLLLFHSSDMYELKCFQRSLIVNLLCLLTQIISEKQKSNHSN